MWRMSPCFSFWKPNHSRPYACPYNWTEGVNVDSTERYSCLQACCTRLLFPKLFCCLPQESKSCQTNLKKITYIQQPGLVILNFFKWISAFGKIFQPELLFSALKKFVKLFSISKHHAWACTHLLLTSLLCSRACTWLAAKCSTPQQLSSHKTKYSLAYNRRLPVYRYTCDCQEDLLINDITHDDSTRCQHTHLQCGDRCLLAQLICNI